METIKGKVSRILFKSNDNAYSVLNVQTNAGNLVVTGDFGADMIPEATADFHGEYKTHPKYGHQFQAYSFELSYDDFDQASIKLFINIMTKWVGPERSEAIVNHFGRDTVKILDEDPSRLYEVKGIGKTSVESLVETWKSSRDEWNINKSLYSFKALLYSLGIKEKRAKRIITHLGGRKAEERLRENPYILTEIDGFGFTTADFVAKKLGVSEDSPARLEAFILYSIKVLCPGEGHLFYLKSDLIKQINKYVKDTDSLFMGRVVTEEDINTTIEKLCEKKLIVQEDGRIYSKTSYNFEDQSASLLSSIISKPSDLIFLTKATIEDHIKKFEEENGILLSDEQKEALYCLSEEKVFVITGLPGSGKTTVLKAIVEIIQNIGLHFTPLTPTGISAKKLSSTINCEAYTIHRRLGFRGNAWLCNELAPYKTDVIILDEASMLDQEVLYRLLSAIEKRTHIIFVGDHYQLPSVGAGNVLRDLIGCGSIHTIHLEKIFRQKEASDIIKVAHKVKNGDCCLDMFSSDPKSDVFFVRQPEISEIERCIVALAQKFKDEKRLFQIITPRNEGPLSVDTLNNILQGVLNPPSPLLKEIKFKYSIVRRGDRVIVTKNDYERDIYNGDIGKVTGIQGGTILLQIDENTVEIPVEEAEDRMKLAYAITIHKCIAKNSRVFCQEGIKPITSIQRGSMVITQNNETHKTVNTIVSEGHKKIILKTSFGYSLESSPEHPILTADKFGESFKKVSDLKPTDFICISRKPVDGIKVYLKKFKKTTLDAKPKQRGRKKIKIPQTLNYRVSWMIGALIGDGCYTNRDDGIVELANQDVNLLKKMENIWGSFGINTSKHYKKGKLGGVYVSSKNFRDWLFNLGMDYIKAPNKKVPEIFFKSNRECRINFLKGLFDADGGIGKSSVCRLTSSSIYLLKDVQILLLSLGIVSSIKTQGPKHHKLQMCGEFLSQFYKIIGFKSKRKQKISKTFVTKTHKKTNVDFIPYGKKIAEDIYYCFKQQEGLTRGIKGKGLFSPRIMGQKIFNVIKKKTRLSFLFLKQVIDIANKRNIKLPDYILSCVKTNYFYDQIKEITPTEDVEDMIDLEIEDNHSFVANGFVCHNSQGQEYPIVIIPLVRQHGNLMLQRNLLYTAITRAKEKVIMLGHGSAVEKAISNATAIKRNTVLGEKIKSYLLELKK